MAKKKSAGKKAGKKSAERGTKKRWSSGGYRSCSNCRKKDHNIRTCPDKAKKKAK